MNAQGPGAATPGPASAPARADSRSNLISSLNKNSRANIGYGTLARNHPSSNNQTQHAPNPAPRQTTPIRHFALRRRYTTSYRLPKHNRPPLLVTLFKNPVRLIPIVLVVAAVVAFIYTFPRDLVPPGADPGLDPHRPIRYRKSTFDWAEVNQRFPVPVRDRKAIPSGPGKDMRAVQHNFGPTYASDPATESRRTAVRRVAKDSWLAYRNKAWGRDTLRPVTGTGKDNRAGWALSLVEALDTLWIMELKSEFHEAAALAAEMDFGLSAASGLFTVDLATRYLGGYLGAYELSGLNPLLLKAKELGEMVYLAFDTRDRMPADWFSFEGARTGRLTPGQRTESNIVGLVLELTRLGQITSDNRYYDAADRLMAFLGSTQMETRLPGLWPEQLDLRRGEVGRDNVFCISGASVGLYQALPSMHMLTGGLEGRYAGMYRRAMSTLQDELLWRPTLPSNDDVIFPGTLYAHRDRTDLVAQTSSTGCTLASVLAVGGKLFDLPHQQSLSVRLADSCVWAHRQFPTNLIPMTFNMLKCPRLDGCEWDEREWLDERRDRRLTEGFTHVPDRRYLSGPETARSLFVLWRTTGRKDLRHIAFDVFEKMLQETQTHNGYAGVDDVLQKPEGDNGYIDVSESYWLGSTLKFFYLMYTHPGCLDLDDWVFSTTGHPLRRPISGAQKEKRGSDDASGL
ncbi:glycoside hydrolase family 47 protein [Zalerion maritima]|uniref:alpha-1,2-Mannosidase n=1 Tax=Zalerion maritima TaxID=339359 RepID=A0AAD5RYK3_9PEZI|nr:glycoside hydrolase family 47 protein [Zalerion maritima]